MAAPARNDDAAYCREQVRRFDRDRYLTTLFAPRPVHDDLLALYAFNLEVAKTREVVREPMMGLVRLQWWRDAVAAIYAGNAPHHQVAQPLSAVVRRHDLSRHHFDSLIDAREADLHGEPPADMPALLAYVDATSAGLGLLTLRILDAAGAPAEAAVRGAWRGAGLIGLLRALPLHLSQRRIHLPQAVMAEHGLGLRHLFELKRPPALPAVVQTIAGEARQHLAAARAAAVGLPRRVLPALLPATLAAADLRRIEVSGYDVFAPAVQHSPPGRIWRLLWASLRGRL
jgi:phytoene synthase